MTIRPTMDDDALLQMIEGTSLTLDDARHGLSLIGADEDALRDYLQTLLLARHAAHRDTPSRAA